MAYYPLKVKDNSGNTHIVGDPRTANKADLASPTFTGTPTAPTAAADTDTTQIATTSFVIGQAASTAPADNGTAAVGTSKKFARADHVHKASASVVMSTTQPSSPTDGMVWVDSDSDVATFDPDTLIGKSLVTTKGQIIAASGSATPAAVPAGSTNGHILTWDTAEATSMKWAAAPASGIPATLLDAKGDLIVASAADTAARLAVGTNGFRLEAASGEATGLKWAADPVCIAVAVSDETTAITTGTAKVTFRMPWAMTVTAVRASLSTASTSGNPTFDINEGGTSILGANKLSIDANEKTSTTAATATSISDSALADDAEITIDIDTAGTGAKGAKVYLIGTKA